VRRILPIFVVPAGAIQLLFFRLHINLRSAGIMIHVKLASSGTIEPIWRFL